MVLFGLLNYEDYIFRTIATSNYARNALTVLFMYLITGVIRFHLSALFCWVFTMDNILDLFIPIVINVVLALLSDTLYQYVGTHRSAYERLVDYLITYYSRDNMIKWRRYFLVGVFTYILIVLALIDINNTFMLVSTIQTAISFIICDLFENREKVYHKIDNFLYRPKASKLLSDFAIIHNYPPGIDNDQPNSPLSDRTNRHSNSKVNTGNHELNNNIIHHRRELRSPLSLPQLRDEYTTTGMPLRQVMSLSGSSTDVIGITLSNIPTMQGGRRSISPPIPVKPPTPPRLYDSISNITPLTPSRLHDSINIKPVTPQRLYDSININPITPPRLHDSININPVTPPRLHDSMTKIKPVTPPRLHDSINIKPITPPRLHDSININPVTPPRLHDSINIKPVTPPRLHDSTSNITTSKLTR
jgi:hypothetical protein